MSVAEVEAYYRSPVLVHHADARLQFRLRLSFGKPEWNHYGKVMQC